MQVKLLKVLVLMMALFILSTQGIFTSNQRNRGSLLSKNKVRFTTHNKEYSVLPYLKPLDCYDYEPQCSVLGNEWSTALSQNADETHLIDTNLDYVIGQQKGYSICAKKVRGGVQHPLVLANGFRSDNVYGELCQRDLFPQRIAFFANNDPSKSYSVVRHNFPFNCVERISECRDLGNQWALATLLHMAEAQPIKSAVRGVLGREVGFSICAKIIGNGVPFPGFISDLHGPQAERKIIHGELCVKGPIYV